MSPLLIKRVCLKAPKICRIEELYLLLAGSPRPELRSPSLAQLVLRLELPQLMLGDRLGSEESGCS